MQAAVAAARAAIARLAAAHLWLRGSAVAAGGSALTLLRQAAAVAAAALGLLARRALQRSALAVSPVYQLSRATAAARAELARSRSSRHTTQSTAARAVADTQMSRLAALAAAACTAAAVVDAAAGRRLHRQLFSHQRGEYLAPLLPAVAVPLAQAAHHRQRGQRALTAIYGVADSAVVVAGAL